VPLVVFIGAFTPDGKGVAVSGDGGLRLLDVATGRELRTLPAGGQPSFSPDAKVVALSTFERDAPQKHALRLYRVGTGREIGRVDDHAGAHGDFAISPDGKAMVMAAYDKEGGSYTVRVLELATLKERCRFQRPSNEPILRLYAGFSPNCRFVASGADDEIVLWDIATGKEATRLAGHRGRVSGLRFSADGSRLTSWGYDKAVLVWDVSGLPARCRLPVTELSPRDLETRWTDLGGADVARAHRAIWQLVAVPDKSVEFLRSRLRPVAQPDEKRIKLLVAELEDNQAAVRRKAAEELEKLGEQAEPALQEVLASKPSLDLRRRVEALLDRLDAPDVTTADSVRGLRGIEVLEHAGTSEARRLLEQLSRGGGARLTREAKGALERLARRATPDR
jgi:dipeptidyl aminopeptidase/acylaminoacyl peptidase